MNEMRLIDASALLKKGIYSEHAIEIGGRDVVLIPLPDVLKGIAIAPTIDAIPVEWIKDYLGKNEYDGNITKVVVIEEMLFQWKKEQEAR